MRLKIHPEIVLSELTGLPPSGLLTALLTSVSSSVLHPAYADNAASTARGKRVSRLGRIP